MQEEVINNEVQCLSCGIKYSTSDDICFNCGRKTEYNAPPLSEKIIKCGNCATSYEISEKKCPECLRITEYNFPEAFKSEKLDAELLDLLGQKKSKRIAKVKEWVFGIISLTVYTAIAFLFLLAKDDIPFLSTIGFIMLMLPIGAIGFGYFAFALYGPFFLGSFVMNKIDKKLPDSFLKGVLKFFVGIMICFGIIFLFDLADFVISKF